MRASAWRGFATGRLRRHSISSDAEVGAKTRLLALSHVAWTTGHVLPVRELKEATGLPVLVDGAQSVGALPVRAAGFDFYTVSGQKWLCGPDAIGALYVADPDALRISKPSYFAQDGFEPDGSFTAREGAARFDPGWIPPPSLVGLEAALGGLPEWRFERAAEMAKHARERLAERVDVVTEPGHAGLISWRFDGDAVTARGACLGAGCGDPRPSGSQLAARVHRLLDERRGRRAARRRSRRIRGCGRLLTVSARPVTHRRAFPR